jgi:hypothetical protein
VEGNIHQMTPEIIRFLRLRGTRVIGQGNYMVFTGTIRHTPTNAHLKSNALYLFKTADERVVWVAARTKVDPNFPATIFGPWPQETEKAVLPNFAERR